MIPLSLRATNLRSYPALEFQIPDGICAVTGPNGAGKSTLLGAIELALFADGARDLAPALGPFSDRLELTLEFEHNDERYRVRRSYTGGGRGKATLDLEEWEPLADEENFHSPAWLPITRESTSATQAHLETLLGLNRATFNASAFLAQGNSAAFPEASPSERKALLGTILDPHALWPSLAERATTDRKTSEQGLATQQARIADREPVAAEVPERHRDVDKAGIAVQQAAANYEQADEAYEQARATVAANEAAAERYRSAQEAERVAREAASKAQQALGEARQRGHEAGEARGRLSALAIHAATAPEIERYAEVQRQTQAAAEIAMEKLREAREAVGRQKQRCGEIERDIATARIAFDSVAGRLLHIENSEPGDQRCDRCDQILGTEARDIALTSLRTESQILNDQVLAKIAALDEAGSLIPALERDLDAIEVPTVSSENYTESLAAARRAQQDHAALQATLAALDEQAARVPWLEEEAHQAEHAAFTAQAALELARGAQVDPKVLEETAERTRVARANRRVDLDDANTAHTRAETALTRAQEAASELATLRRDVSASLEQLATYRLAERAYGRDGVPALIAENTVGVIETEANRVLERLPTASGTTFRVELRTQRALKGDATALRETLDILVSDRTTTREFLTFSGGERFRVSFALRWALAKLLAGRRGAESRLLVIDEPDGLDAGGMDGLAAMLRENADVFSKVLLVSHNPLLASAFEQVVSVESDGDVSRLVA